jgi:hypothetical protein
MQLDENWILMRQGMKGTPSKEDWLHRVLGQSGRIGVDPSLISIG